MTIEPEPRPRHQRVTPSELAERRRRLGLLGAAFGLGFLSIGLRLLGMVDWHAADGPFSRGVLAPAADAALTDADSDLPPGRAEITDRNGELLATNLMVPSLYIDPTVIADRDKEATARRLATVLADVDEATLAERLSSRRHFAWLKHQITPQEQRAVLDLGVPGIGFRMAPHRIYPKRNLTSHLVGFADLDSKGLSGVERELNDRLGRDAGKGPVALSLDLKVQQAVREELFSAFVRLHAKGAAGLVVDAQTGETLAMVSLPDFDPNQPPSTAVGRQTAEDKGRLINRATNGTYELGSLFKVVSIAAAIDSGQVGLKDSFDATQPLRIKGARIDDVHAKRRWLSVPECFMYSSNICTAKVALKVGGGQILEPFFRKVGFYEKPDIQLPQAELGRPQVPHRWSDVVSATTSFGHGIAVSPFQYVDAVAGIVRDAPWVKPTLLRRAPEAALPTRPAPVDRRTSRDMRWLMWLTVEKGSGKAAQEPAYLLGGKTGTADKPKEHGRGYQKGAVLASFAGVFPIEAPRYIVVALIDEPKADSSTGNTRYGGAVSAPIVGKIVDRIGPLLGAAPSEVAAKGPFMERLVVTKGPGRWEERVAALPATR